MQYIIFGILGIIAVLLGIAVIRTLMIKAPEIGECKTEITPEEIETAAKKLGDMVRVPTVSKNAPKLKVVNTLRTIFTAVPMSGQTKKAQSKVISRKVPNRYHANSCSVESSGAAQGS